MRERRLRHREEAEQFYPSVSGQPVRVGMEGCGHYRWFERLLAECGHELWVGNAAKIRAMVVRKQKTDRRDAGQGHVMHLLIEERFPRIWVPSLQERDARQLLVDRHKQVQTRTRVKNQLQAMALGQGVQKKRKLWTEAGRAELEKLELLWIERTRALVETQNLFCESEMALLENQKAPAESCRKKSLDSGYRR